METFMDYFIMAVYGVLGIGMHILMKWRDVYTKQLIAKRENLPVVEKMDWKLHVINTGTATVVIAILLMLGNKINDFFPINEITMLMAGYASDSIWKNFVKRTFTKMGAE